MDDNTASSDLPKTPPEDNPTPSALTGNLQIALVIIAGIAVLGAILHGFYPDRVDQTTAIFLGVAIVTLLSNQVTKFKGFGIEVEKQVQELRVDLKNAQKAFVGLEKDVGPGSKSAVSSAPPTSAPGQRANILPSNSEDPNKGQFGGLAERNGRKLTATIKPLAGPKSSRCNVVIMVISTDSGKPLTGDVTFHLHPTFGQWASYKIPVKGGVAEDTISSYGAFTIGVEADAGATRLELDLINVEGGTKAFYMS